MNELQKFASYLNKRAVADEIIKYTIPIFKVKKKFDEKEKYKNGDAGQTKSYESIRDSAIRDKVT